MILLLLLFGELIILYILSQRLTQSLFDLVYRITKSRTMGITFVMLITFPGTVIHELSHLFTAEILGVRTGKLTLVPENLQSEEIKAGSVMIAQSDPFRRYAIGCAPIFAGIVAISAISYFLFTMNYDLLTFLYFYLLFAISSSMFSSSEDLKGFVPFALTIGIMITAAYLAGLRIGLTGTLLTFFLQFLETLTKSLGIVLAVQIVIFIITQSLLALFHKL